MKVYQLRVSIIGLARVYRIIEASEDCTLDDLHDEIFDAFDRFDPHLYSFFITRKDTDSFRAIYDAPEFTHPDNTEPFMGEAAKDSAAETRIGDIGLKEKEVFHYLFDFGDDWWHRIRVQSVKEVKAPKEVIRITKSVGNSPPQYPDYEDEEFDEEDE
ncbi:hypothetical protein DENIS_0100 [Desulfonema ishimotonii]|uniref:Plasmid pRiA4b Orf3-like domain-containing protein n=2 Tax=Desulfonema ishimotonii TaxID=45657 RepID=A0A401FQA2_9BACT|nr:hypothetical protein DENIS_0100 [Desulfonema ishimotonii]